MSAEIVNLRRARKNRARAVGERRAEENRIRFGRTKAARRREEDERLRADTALDGARRDPPASDEMP